MIPIYKPFLQRNEVKYVNDCSESTWISSRGNYMKSLKMPLEILLGASILALVVMELQL